ncbi:amino acid ABC transporter substrate-binding protein [Rhodohalobacter sp. SW132]|uniref:substrate-binding periplasmic protein n=1 Tax=Rhodohalobacter sp. SW132 TaxID=2293433 RepID=UPI000E23C458|nr:transporter substrate-binding domain-containing protein [Rhodohalobacter sp. SW132]REL37848.1 amino acid ABC transporter substrate-binding protein [Rhodohalobacter sp. SW132]
MKHPAILSAFLILILLVSGCVAESDQVEREYDGPVTWAAVQDEGHGVLRVLYVPADGFAYTNEEGELTGLTVELIIDFTRFLAEEHDVLLELDFVEVENWTDFYNDIVEGEDGMIGMGNVTITEERREELSFSPPYMTNIASLISHINTNELTGFEEMSSVFEGRDALAFEGTLHEDRLRNLTEQYHPDAEIALATSNDEIIERVGASDSYFAYIDIYNYWRAVDRGADIQRHEAGDEAAEQFGYIMPLNSTWEPVLNEYFEKNGGLLLTTRYREIMAEHLGERLTELLIEAHRQEISE